MTAQANQTKTGKAFEYALLHEFKDKLSRLTEVRVLEGKLLEKAASYFHGFSAADRGAYLLAASFAVNLFMDIEPRLSHPASEADPLELELISDDFGKRGDVRDVIAIRRAQEWELGVSAKNNHWAVKHPRLSQEIDFGKLWLGMPCSQEYFKTIEPVFTNLKSMQVKSGQTRRWDEIEDKDKTVYRPLLDAFQTELMRLYNLESSRVAAGLVEYLVGRKDFYKVIKSKRKVEIMAYNLHGTLNLPSGSVEPKIRTNTVDLPTAIHSIAPKVIKGQDSSTTLLVSLDKGWELSFRIHSARSTVEPSLKFDVSLARSPASIYRNTFTTV